MNGLRTSRLFAALAALALVTGISVTSSAPPTRVSAGPAVGQWIDVWRDCCGSRTNVIPNGWPDGTLLTLEVDRGNNGSIEYTDSHAAPSAFFVDPKVESNDLIRVSGDDGTGTVVSKELIVERLRVDHVDPATDVVQGFAPVDRTVEVITNQGPGEVTITTTADANGRFSVDFTGLFDIQPWGSNLAPSDSASARIVEGDAPDGDTMSDSWIAVSPNIQVQANDGGMYPSSVGTHPWREGTELLIEVDHGNNGSVEQSQTLTWPNWFGVDTKLEVGDLVRVSGAGWVKEIIVEKLLVDYVNPDSNVVAGFAPAGRDVQLIVGEGAGQQQLTATANGSGRFSADFTPVFDIQQWFPFAPQTPANQVHAILLEGNALPGGPDGDTMDDWSGAIVPTITVQPKCCGNQAFIGIGYKAWRAGTELTIDADRVDNTILPDFHKVMTVAPNQGQLTNFGELQPLAVGDKVTVSGAGWTKVLYVDLIRTDMTDPATDVVAGIAMPNKPISVNVFAPNVGGGGFTLSTTSDGAGFWSVDFSPSGLPVVFDLQAIAPPSSQGINASVFDDDGDSTQNMAQVVVPIVQACVGGMNAGCGPNGTIQPMNWNEGTPVTAEIDTDHNGTVDHTLGPIPYSNSGMPGWSLMNPGWLQDLSIVRVSGGGWTKELTVRKLTIDSADTAADHASGTGPASTVIDVSAFANFGQTMTTMHDVAVDGSGHWTADFSGQYDIAGGTHVQAVLPDADGDSSVANFQVPAQLDISPAGFYSANQVITITGTNWLPSTTLYVTQCGINGFPNSCDNTTQTTYSTTASGSATGSFTLKRYLNGGSIDCAATSCGLVATQWSGAPNTGGMGLLAIDYPQNNPVPFKGGTLTAVTPSTDLIDGQSVTLHGEGLNPNVQVFIWRCQAFGDPATYGGGFVGNWCNNVDGTQWWDDANNVMLPHPAAYTTMTDSNGAFDITFTVPEHFAQYDFGCGATVLCGFVATASAGPGAFVDAQGNEVRLQFRTQSMSWPYGQPGQPNVMMLLTSGGSSLFDVRPVNHTAASPAPPAGVTFPLGVLNFKVHVTNFGDSTSLTISPPPGSDASAINSYYTLSSGAWVPYANAALGVDGAITLWLTDGGAGDADGAANGVIVALGASAIGPNDADGVPPTVENGGPNNGDGNNDGVLDSAQANVVSLPSQVPGQPYVTIESPSGTSMDNVSTLDPTTLSPPTGVTFPVGLTDFTLSGVTPGATVTVKLYVEGSTLPTTYWKYQGGVWSDYTAHTNLSANPILITLTDKTGVQVGLGDDNAAPGVIHDPSGPSTGTAPWPKSGFFKPVDNPPAVNVVRAGSTIPVKFGLGGNRGLAVFADGYPQSAQIACGSNPTLTVGVETDYKGRHELKYDKRSNRYEYQWETDRKWKGTCRQLIVKFADGTIMRANFQFK